MKRRIFSTCAALALFLAACSPAPTPPPTPSPTPALPTVTPPPTFTPAPQATLPPPTATLSVTAPVSDTTFAPISESDWQLGPAEALVTIVTYSDFQCPTCALLAPTLNQLHAEYPDDVRIVYRHYPLFDIHDKAVMAAEAAEAAGAQGKFWEMHNLLYERQSAWSALAPTDFRNVLVESYAAQLGLDAVRFAADLDNRTFGPKLQAAFNEAFNAGIPGTPLILFNGVIYQGPIDHWAFDALIKLEKLKGRQYPAPPEAVIHRLGNYVATLHTLRGDIVVQLFAETAPLTVNNFVFLARDGWYDGVTFHRVLIFTDTVCACQTGVAQAGDPSGTGYGGPGYFIPDELNPDLKFDGPGWVGMANAGPNTNGSQFFITLGPLPMLDGKYTIFGKIIGGMDVAWALTLRDPSANPEAPPGDAILGVTIEEK
jgi:cyclophilin family peptidyl-prolyl cis-trans isomerase/protein-disulfide isomerase